MTKWHNSFILSGCVFLYGLIFVVSFLSLHMADIRIASLNVNGARDDDNETETT